MAQRSRATLKKRQRELARQEKQRDKVARREQRKMDKNNPGAEGDTDDIEFPEGALLGPEGTLLGPIIIGPDGSVMSPEAAEHGKEAAIAEGSTETERA